MILYTKASSVMKLNVFLIRFVRCVRLDLCVDLRCVYCVYIIYVYIFLFPNEVCCNYLQRAYEDFFL